MSIFNDSFSIELKHPLDEEAWKVLEDAELDNTVHIYFTTPSGKRVDFIRADVLDKIRAEIQQEYEQERFARSVFREEKNAVKAEQCTGSIWAFHRVIGLIDKHRESEVENDTR